MSIEELLAHSWLHEGRAPNTPLQSPQHLMNEVASFHVLNLGMSHGSVLWFKCSFYLSVVFCCYLNKIFQVSNRVEQHERNSKTNEYNFGPIPFVYTRYRFIQVYIGLYKRYRLCLYKRYRPEIIFMTFWVFALYRE